MAVLKGCRHPESARDFVDFLLTPEIQSMLARFYGETPSALTRIAVGSAPWQRSVAWMRR